jgi:formylmethanofuran dehydrogenase subunit E
MLSFFGDGISVPCHGTCGRETLLYSEFTKDLYPIPARKGGRYVKGNVRPMCMSCNAADGARQAALERKEAMEKRNARNARRRELYAQRKTLGMASL